MAVEPDNVNEMYNDEEHDPLPPVLEGDEVDYEEQAHAARPDKWGIGEHLDD